MVTANPIYVGNNSGNVQVRLRETDNQAAGCILTSSSAFTAVLEGSVTITGSASYGRTITANVTGEQTDAVLSCQWKKGATNVGTNSNTYTLGAGDIGATFTVAVTAAGYTGELTSTATQPVTKAPAPASPEVPAAAAVGTDSITLIAIPDAEYKQSEGIWQDSQTFSGLSDTTPYTFYARIKETGTQLPSQSSAAAKIYTRSAAPDQFVVTMDYSNETIYFDPAVYEMNTADVEVSESGAFAYRMGNGALQASNIFSDLDFDTEHTFEATRTATASAFRSAAGSEVKTWVPSNFSAADVAKLITTITAPAKDTKGMTTAATSAAIETYINGAAAASVTTTQITSAVTAAVKEAEKTGTDNAVVEIAVKAANSTKGVSVTIPRVAFGIITDSTVNMLTVSSPTLTVTFGETALTEISKNMNGDIKITATSLDKATLSEEDKAKIGDRPVYDLTVTSGNVAISSFGGGTATLSIPYTLAAGEDANKIVIYCLSDSGELIIVPNCIYDAESGTVIFTTTHFSAYVVAYNDATFPDVSGWCEAYVNYLTARGIINGMGNDTFAPDSSITRAQLVTLLAKL